MVASRPAATIDGLENLAMVINCPQLLGEALFRKCGADQASLNGFCKKIVGNGFLENLCFVAECFVRSR